MASRSLGSLTLDLIARTQGFVSGMTAAERKAIESNKKIQREMKDLADSIDKWATRAGVAAGAAIATATAALTALTVASFDAIDRQSKLAKQLGATSNELMLVSRAADLSGVEMEMLSSNMKRFNDTVGEGLKGSKNAVETFERMGTTAEAVARMTLPERIALLQKAMAGLSSQAQRATLAQDLFGKAGQEMLPFLQDQGESMRVAADEIKKFNIAISEVDAAKVEAANDAFSGISFFAKGAGEQIAIAFAPAVLLASEKITDLAGDGKSMGETVYEAFRTASLGAALLADAGQAVTIPFRALSVALQSAKVAFMETAKAGTEFFLLLKPKDQALKTDLERITADLVGAREQLGKSTAGLVDTVSQSYYEKFGAFFDEVERRKKEAAAPLPPSTGEDGPPTPPGKDKNGKGEALGVHLAKALAQEEEYQKERRERAIAEQEAHSELLRLRFADEARYREEDEAATKESQERKKQMYRDGADAIGRLLEQAGKKSRTLAKAALVWQKANALAQIAIDTPKAAMAAASAVAAIPVVGPSLAAAAAAAMYALGGAAAASVLSGGGGGGAASVPTAGVSPTAPAITNPTVPEAQRATVFDIRLIGAGSRPSWEEVRQMMEEIGERMADSGGRIGKVTVLTA